MLALAHHIGGDGTQHEHVHQPGYCHGCQRQEGVKAVLRCSETRQTQDLATVGSGQGDHYRQRTLQ